MSDIKRIGLDNGALISLQRLKTPTGPALKLTLSTRVEDGGEVTQHVVLDLAAFLDIADSLELDQLLILDEKPLH